MEGIPDSTSHRLSRFGGHEDLGGFLTSQRYARRRVHRLLGRGRGDRDVRGSVATSTVGRITPTLGRLRQERHEVRVRLSIRRSGLERRETLLSSGPNRAEPKLCGVSTQRKLRKRAGNARGAGKRSRTGGRSRSDASRVLLAGGSKGSSVVRRALAGRKLEAPPDAGHEQRDGEPVREGMSFPVTVRVHSVCGFRLAGSRDDGRHSRAPTHQAFTGRARRDPWLAGQSCMTSPPSQEDDAMGSTSGGFGDRLGCACE
jgi:hypothetical protein